MIRAYRESSANFSARITSAFSPLIAPEITSEPGVFEISYGSPVGRAADRQCRKQRDVVGRGRGVQRVLQKEVQKYCK
jgi:hypothetical protein